ncbi:hypothetical protein FT643_02705 [Ketobacter sp. MCCC 1A13808]|uniref:hypothetical protein n=1 Tax=Ketobacter sp. MCCC 1A13808 TaxID=2602738 RepID=UPI000F17A8FC|nr:hypothetical protein [Ketobacter sp. MCCC 1A13808]MVF11045.1 hypothetical protein [Ketobacter sp. MCCC 1A13808]RLP56427.1 MAG: hypothetical protein D6160_03300 [Ketobacter sp.]
MIKSAKQYLSIPRFRIIVAAISSAITWFAWAYWANRHDPQQAIVSAFYQGGVNLFTTAVGSSALEWLFNKMGDTIFGRISCVFIVSSCSLSLMLTAHLYAATPNLLLTVLPVYIVVLLFCSSYIIGLSKIKTNYDNQEVAT